MSLSILLTGGIGDWLSIESHMSDAQRSSLESVFYATRAQKAIKETIVANQSFPNIKNHTILWDDFSSTFAFHHKSEVIAANVNRQVRATADRTGYSRWMHLLKEVQDYSIYRIFREIPNARPFTGSALLKFRLCKLNVPLPGDGGFATPEGAESFSPEPKYLVVCPYSPNDRRNPLRDFKEMDWAFLTGYLERRRMYGVVLNIGTDHVPTHPLLVDLSNKTSFIESVEVMKRGWGYIGIDSSLSVLAAQLFDSPNLLVKSNNSHCYVNKHIYYAPKRDFKFLARRLG